MAQIIQQASATAEQSAASSQEMSGQFLMLEELISRFKLRDKDFRSLPTAINKTVMPQNELLRHD